MKNRISFIILLAAISFCANKSFSQTQLSRWHTAPDAVNFLTPAPSKITGFAPSTISAYNKAYNSVCDNAGNLIFYIANGTIYNKFNIALGSIPIHSTWSPEIAIVPNPGNLTNPCQEKYYVIFTQTGSLVLNMTYGEVDAAANSGNGSFAFTNPVIGLTGTPANPLAVSKVTASGKRYLYFGGLSTAGVNICEITASGITNTSTNAYPQSSDGMEMELSDAGDKLVFSKSVSGNHEVIVVNLNPLTGQPVGTPTIYNTGFGAINGLEFNNSGTKVFYSKAGSSPGVYWQDLGTSTFSPNLIGSTSSFGFTMLEKIYGGNEIACASSSQIRGISTGVSPGLTWSLSHTLPTIPSSFGGSIYLMPDQIDGENYDASKSVLIPSFTTNSPYCYGDSITVNGAASYGTLNGVVTPGIITTHVWIISGCNAAGFPSGPDFWIWGTGSPGSFTFPSVMPGGPVIQCGVGGYYLIKLALLNCDVPWAETTLKIQVLCPPVANLGPDQTICAGDCTTLSLAGTPKKKPTYTWFAPNDPTVDYGNDATLTVCPTQTTTYCVTITSLVTGCSATDCITVNVESVNPSFSITDDVTNSAFVGLTASPFIPTSLPAGYAFAWFVEELDASLNSLYVVNSNQLANTSFTSSCWWDFPGAEVFNGFNGLTFPTAATLDPVNCLPPQGQFKYNTFYRITRGVWSTNCGWKQMSKIFYSNPSSADGTPGYTDTYEDVTAPDMSDGFTNGNSNGNNGNHSFVTFPLGTSNNSVTEALKVYPNPANSFLNIEYSLTNKTSGKILITDLTGRTLKTIVLTEGSLQTQVDISDLINGVYFVNLYESGKRSETKKIIVAK